MIETPYAANLYFAIYNSFCALVSYTLFSDIWRKVKGFMGDGGGEIVGRGWLHWSGILGLLGYADLWMMLVGVRVLGIVLIQHELRRCILISWGDFLGNLG